MRTMKFAGAIIATTVALLFGNISTASAFVGECTNFQIDQDEIVQLLLKAGLEGTTNSNFKNIDVAVEDMISEIASKGVANSQDFDADQAGRDCAYALAEEAKDQWAGYMAKYIEKKRREEEALAKRKAEDKQRQAEIERKQRENEVRIAVEAERRKAEIDRKRREQEAKIVADAKRKQVEVERKRVESERKRKADAVRHAKLKQGREAEIRRKAEEKRKNKEEAVRRAKLKVDRENREAAEAEKREAEKRAQIVIDEAWLAVDEGNDKKAVSLFGELVRVGNASAQHDLALMYETGKGVTQSDKEALRLFTLAAAQGHADAQYMIGYYHAEAIGTEKLFQTAAKWYLKAASLGHVEAQFSLAELYFRGEGVPRSFDNAEKWYLKAETEGHELAGDRLAKLDGARADAHRQAELEKKRKEEKERKRAVLEQKKKEEDARRRAELEQKREEDEARRQAELEQKQKEEETRRQAELELKEKEKEERKQKEEEERKQAELDNKRKAQRALESKYSYMMSGEYGLSAYLNQMPKKQLLLIETVNRHKGNYLQVSNELAKSSVRRKRARAVCNIFGGSVPRRLTGWIVRASTIRTNSDGFGILRVKLSDAIEVGTHNNSFSDSLSDVKTMIPPSLPIYNTLSEISEGNILKVTFRFLTARQDCIEESSMTEKGSMTEPDYVAAFEAIEVLR
jgi:TPR repeat protein